MGGCKRSGVPADARRREALAVYGEVQDHFGMSTVQRLDGAVCIMLL